MFKQYLAFTGLTMIAFIAFLEYMAVNNALPSIQDVFHVSILNLQWINNVYSITLAATMILFGRLGDIFGYRRIFYLGIILFLLGSFGAGITRHFELLIFFRGIQSLGIAAILVVVPGIIQLIFQGNTHLPMSIYAAITGIGLIIGPYLGGIIVMYWGWQWVFYINIPLLILGYILCAFFVPQFQVKPGHIKIDWIGNILLVISMVSLIYMLIRQQEAGFDPATISCLLIFLISTPILIYVEINQKQPLLNFKFFKQREFILASLSNAMAGGLVSCGMFFSPIFLQKIHHLSPKDTGSLLFVFAFGTVIFSPIIGRIFKKIRERKSIFIGLSCGLVASFMYILFFAFNILPLGLLAFFLTGACLAVNNVVSAMTAIKGVGESNAGVAVGTIFAIFNIIAGIMLAIGSVIFHFFNQHYFNPIISYTSVFIIVSIYSIILFLTGLKVIKSDVR